MGGTGRRGKGKVLFVQTKQCRRDEKIRKSPVSAPKAMVDSSKDPQWWLKLLGQRSLGMKILNLKVSPHAFFLITAVPPGLMECEGHIIAEVVFYAKNVKS